MVLKVDLKNKVTENICKDLRKVLRFSNTNDVPQNKVTGARGIEMPRLPILMAKYHSPDCYMHEQTPVKCQNLNAPNIYIIYTFQHILSTIV